MTGEVCWEVIPTPRSHKTPPSHQAGPKKTSNRQPLSGSHENAITKTDLMFIKDLNPAEKSKIALMIQQIVRLENDLAALTGDYEEMKLKLDSKTELCSEMEECMDQLSTDNERLQIESRAQQGALVQYSHKLEETEKLLKLSSSTNKKLQKRLSVKKLHVQVQTDDEQVPCSQAIVQSSIPSASSLPNPASYHLPTNLPLRQQPSSSQPPFIQPASSTNTILPAPVSSTNPFLAPAQPNLASEQPLQDSMNLFLDKLDNLCDRLSAVDRAPVVQPARTVSVHNHKTDGGLVRAPNNPGIVYREPEDGGVDQRRREEERGESGGVLGTRRIRDSLILVKEQKGGKSERQRYNNKLFSLINEIEEVSGAEEEDDDKIISDLFFNVG